MYNDFFRIPLTYKKRKNTFGEGGNGSTNNTQVVYGSPMEWTPQQMAAVGWDTSYQGIPTESGYFDIGHAKVGGADTVIQRNPETGNYTATAYPLDEVVVTPKNNPPLAEFNTSVRQKEYPATFEGLLHGWWDKLTGNDTYMVQPATVDVNYNETSVIENKADEQRYLNSRYENALEPYSNFMDWDYTGRGTSKGNFTTGNEAGSKLGNLGLVHVKDNIYNIYDANGKLIKQCAMTRNEIEKVLGHPTTNNAWDTFGIYGDSTLINGYSPKIGPYTTLGHTILNNAAASNVQRNINNVNLQSGDYVDLFSPLSHYNKRAWQQGTLNRSNSHTGVIYQPINGDRQKTYVIHNVGGKVYVDPIGEFFLTRQNGIPKWRITGIHRPGTKEHPYYNSKGEPIHK